MLHSDLIFWELFLLISCDFMECVASSISRWLGCKTPDFSNIPKFFGKLGRRGNSSFEAKQIMKFANAVSNMVVHNYTDRNLNSNRDTRFLEHTLIKKALQSLPEIPNYKTH